MHIKDQLQPIQTSFLFSAKQVTYLHEIHTFLFTGLSYNIKMVQSFYLFIYKFLVYSVYLSP